MSHEPRGPARSAALTRIAAVLLLLAVAGGARGDAALTTADVVRFLKVGISERTIVAELQGRGFAETLDPAREATLREAGASETLVAAVHRAAPAAPAAPPAPEGPSEAAPVASGGVASFAARTRTVRVPVSVLDDSGRPLIGLRVEDFQVSDDGRRQPVTLFSGERKALRIALALDVSGSMSNKIRQVEQALRHFIDLLTPAGSTALYDAAAEAIRRVAPGPAESKAVVLVSDGVDTASSTSFEVLRELARRSEVPVFSIGLDAGAGVRSLYRLPGRSGPGGGGPRFPGVGGRGRGPGGGRGGWPGGGPRGWPGGGGGSDPASITVAGFDARPLRDLADDTGARAEVVKGLEHYTPGSEAPGSERLKAAVESIALTLRHRYLLGYEPPEGKAGWRTIRVQVARPSAQARTRKGYYAGA